MEFLKEIFNNKALTYDELVQAINAHNGNEANKEKQIKIGNLGGGEYVGKGKHESEIEKLNSLLTGKDTEISKANELIEELKKSVKGNDELQGKFVQYEKDKADLQQQLHDTKCNSALKIRLLTEKALDVGYLIYKINEKLREEGKTLELDGNDNIKGIDDLISSVKTQNPTQFESSQQNKIEPNLLPVDDGNKSGVTQEQFNKMGYQSRLKLKQEQPEIYAQMTGKQTN